MKEVKKEPEDLASTASRLGRDDWGLSRYSIRSYLITVSWFFGIALSCCAFVLISEAVSNWQLITLNRILFLLGVTVLLSLFGPLVFGFVVLILSAVTKK